jgi:hypothetical protein
MINSPFAFTVMARRPRHIMAWRLIRLDPRPNRRGQVRHGHLVQHEADAEGQVAP